MRILFLSTVAGALMFLSAHADEREPGWWASALRDIPEGWIAGRIYRTEDEGRKVFVAVFPRGADHPMTPGNAFDPGQVLEVSLQRKGADDTYVSSRIYVRSPDDRAHTDNENRQAEILERLYAQAERVSGIMPCQLRGWAASDSSMGAAVRAAPDDAAVIVGRLAPPRWSSVTEAASIDGIRAEFDITGYRDGWFRIENATPPGVVYGDPPPEGYPPTYSGAGWIRVTEVRANYANTQMPVPRLLQYPHVDAADFEPGDDARSYSGDLDGDGTLMRLHACSGNWALTTSRDSQRGWWRGTCSNQVTNCS